MDDSSIRTAVTTWFDDQSAAEATYGHISSWATGGVTDMKELFCADDWCDYYNSAAPSFNEDIGAWDTSGVTTMKSMFNNARAFNQDIGGWRVEQVTDMSYIIHGASAFDQDLGWCVGDDVNLDNAFDDTQCYSTSCGVTQSCDYPMTDSNIRTAVTAWFDDATAAEATYGHISTWETGGVTDMSYLFCAESWDECAGSAAASFNEDIGAWDTSGVTAMNHMFLGAAPYR